MRKPFTTAAVGVLLAGSLLVPSLARAAGPVPTELTQLVDAQTLAIGRVEVSKVAPDQWLDFVSEMLKASPLEKEFVDDATTRLQKMKSPLMTQYQRVVAAGVTDVYIVLKPGDPLSMILVVPGAADPKAVEAMAKEMGLQTRLMGTSVVAVPPAPAGSRGDIDKMLKVDVADRPELFAALAKAGDHAVTFGGAMPDAVKQELLQTPNLPKDMGGDPMTLITDGMQSAYMSLEAPPKFGMNLAVVAKDEAAADKLNEWIAARQGELPEALKSLMATAMDAAKPTVKGNQLQMSVNANGLQELVNALGPAFMTARKSAMRIASMSNMRQMMQASLIYAADHQNQAPPDLASLQAVLQTDDEAFKRLLTNPLHPESPGEGYVYVKPAVDKLSQIRDSAERVAIYEAGEFNDGKSVAFWDGHVEFISDQGQFEALLKESKSPR